MKQQPWTKEDVKYLHRMFPRYTTAFVASEMGRPTEAVKKKANRLGLRKSKRYMRSLGRK